MSDDGRTRGVALVTGAAYGIGASVAERLAIDGYDLTLTAEASCDEVAERCAATVVDTVVVDLATPDATTELVDAVETTHGRLDCVVFNAGITLATPIDQIDGADLRRLLAINLESGLLISGQAVRLLRSSPHPAIVWMSSIHGVEGFSGHAAYAASKGAIIAAVRAIACELAPLGIRVNAVAPGMVAVERTLRSPGYHERNRRCPLGRAATPDEIAAAVSFLVSEEASFITGATLLVDGGAHARSSLALERDDV